MIDVEQTVKELRMIADFYEETGVDRLQRETMRNAAMLIEGLVQELATKHRPGRWLSIKDDYGHFYAGQCSNCGCEPTRPPFRELPYGYCPNCGAIMDQRHETSSNGGFTKSCEPK